MFSEKANQLFIEAIEKYHIKDDVYQDFVNPYDKDADLLAHLLYRKCWIDTVQWHYEDIIRDPHINPVDALDLKRKLTIHAFEGPSGNQKLVNNQTIPSKLMLSLTFFDHFTDASIGLLTKDKPRSSAPKNHSLYPNNTSEIMPIKIDFIHFMKAPFTRIPNNT